MAPPRVLITNDDGPPGPESPFVFGLFKHLKDIGWDVKVVLPSSQKSWIGKAYQIKDVIGGEYYYPKEPDGLGERSSASRPLKEGEVAEWILLHGTPATCTNIALHNMYPGEIDLVLSGPNFGRNTSSAFSLSSGTIGAALSSSLSLVRSVALSYGIFAKPCPTEYYQPAHELSSRIIQRLLDKWGTDPAGTRDKEVDLYSINIPMTPELLHEGGMPVVWTRIWMNNYGRLFSHVSSSNPGATSAGSAVSTTATSAPQEAEVPKVSPVPDTAHPPLLFKFTPQIKSLIDPSLDSLPHGTDAWAVHTGKASVSPLRACFAQPGRESFAFGDEVVPEGEKAGDGQGGGRLWTW